MGIYEKIYCAVKKIPRGRVATYGQIAAIVGIPKDARRVGYALSALLDDSDVPWQRVINAKGEISERPSAEVQRIFLEQEGIIFTKCAQIDLLRFQWKPMKRTQRTKR
jgi:methylated-DNA-protein-cysteine methyltransferase-like protein